MRQVSAHWNPLAVADGSGVRAIDIVLFKIPATEKAHHDAGASGRISLLFLHRFEQSLPGIRPGPYTCQA